MVANEHLCDTNVIHFQFTSIYVHNLRLTISINYNAISNGTTKIKYSSSLRHYCLQSPQQAGGRFNSTADIADIAAGRPSRALPVTSHKECDVTLRDVMTRLTADIAAIAGSREQGSGESPYLTLPYLMVIGIKA